MKRDMGLIRLLLLGQEGEEVDLSSYSEEALLYHYALAIEAGLLRGDILEHKDGTLRGAAVIRMTWEGHDFIDAARNESVWKKATSILSKNGMTLSFAVLTALLTSIAKEKIGLK